MRLLLLLVSNLIRINNPDPNQPRKLRSNLIEGQKPSHFSAFVIVVRYFVLPITHSHVQYEFGSLSLKTFNLPTLQRQTAFLIQAARRELTLSVTTLLGAFSSRRVGLLRLDEESWTSREAWLLARCWHQMTIDADAYLNDGFS